MKQQSTLVSLSVPCVCLVAASLLVGCATAPAPQPPATSTLTPVRDVCVPVTASTNYPSLRELMWSYEWDAGALDFEHEPSASDFWKGMRELGTMYDTFRFIDGVLRVVP